MNASSDLLIIPRLCANEAHRVLMAQMHEAPTPLRALPSKPPVQHGLQRSRKHIGMPTFFPLWDDLFLELFTDKSGLLHARTPEGNWVVYPTPVLFNTHQTYHKQITTSVDNGYVVWNPVFFEMHETAFKADLYAQARAIVDLFKKGPRFADLGCPDIDNTTVFPLPTCQPSHLQPADSQNLQEFLDALLLLTKCRKVYLDFQTPANPFCKTSKIAINISGQQGAMEKIAKKILCQLIYARDSFLSPCLKTRVPGNTTATSTTPESNLLFVHARPRQVVCTAHERLQAYGVVEEICAKHLPGFDTSVLLS